MIAAEVLVAQHFRMAGKFLLFRQNLLNDRRRSLRADGALAALALERGGHAGVAFEQRDVVARKPFQIVGQRKIAVNLHVALVKRIPLDRPRTRMLLVDQRLQLGKVAVSLQPQRDINAFARVHVRHNTQQHACHKEEKIEPHHRLLFQLHTHTSFPFPLRILRRVYIIFSIISLGQNFSILLALHKFNFLKNRI